MALGTCSIFGDGTQMVVVLDVKPCLLGTPFTYRDQEQQG